MKFFEKIQIVMLFTILGIGFVFILMYFLGIGRFVQVINIVNNSELIIDSVQVISNDGSETFRSVIKAGQYRQMHIPEASDENNDSLDVTIFIDSEVLPTRIYSYDTIIVGQNKKIEVRDNIPQGWFGL